MINFMICLVSMSWQASVIILVIVLQRKLLAAFRLPRKYIMMLWLIPYFFLIFPWKLTSPVAFWAHAPADYQIEGTVQADDESLKISGNEAFHLPQAEPPKTRQEENPGIRQTEGKEADQEGNPGIRQTEGKETDQEGNSGIRQTEGKETGQEGNSGIRQTEGKETDQEGNSGIRQTEGKETDQEENPGAGQTNVQEMRQEGILGIRRNEALGISGIVWGMGLSVLLGHSVVSYVKLRRRLICSTCVRDNIYFADDISTPMVVGIFRPGIYIPSGIQAECQAYAIWHEETHIRRKDPVTKMLAFLITGLHWFNPLVWFAYHLFCTDMEMACDEETVRRIGFEKRKDYAGALVVLSTGKRRVFTLPPAFGEGNTAGRIKNIFILKRPGRHLTGIMVVTGFLLVFCFITKSEAAQAGIQREENSGTNDPGIGTGDGGSVPGLSSAVDEMAGILAEFDGEPEYTPADGASAVMLTDKAAEAETGGVSLWRREGYQETDVHLYIPEKYKEQTPEIGEADRELWNQKAQRALRELYDLTGTQIEECYYYVFVSNELLTFGRTPDDLEHGRDFMTRSFSDITTLDIVSSRRVWYSDVNMYALPDDYAEMTEKEKAIWFVTHSGLWNGMQAVEAVQPYDWDRNIWHVIMEDDTAYEITLDSEAEGFSNLAGPYPDSNIQH